MEDQLQKRLQRWLSVVPKPEGRSEVWGNRIVVGTATGLVREDNQDRAIVVRATFARSPERNFAAAVICDGIGGMSRGGDAASLAVSTFAASLVRSKQHFVDTRLSFSVEAANAAVFDEMSGHGGATLSAVLIDEQGVITAANVGDSRIYEMRKEHKLVQLTTDDTLEGQFHRANLNRAANFDSSGRPELRQLVQYVGMGKGIEPHILRCSPRSELEYIVITSDGAHGAHHEMLSEVLRTSANSDEIADRLLALSRWLGGKDNATVVAIDLKHADMLTADTPGGAVVEVWSPFGKVEFWGPTISQGPEERPQLRWWRSKESTSRCGRAVYLTGIRSRGPG